MTADNKSMPERDDALQQAIADYLQALASGRPMERAHLLARHPELAEELQAFFTDHDQARAWAEPLRALAPKAPEQEFSRDRKSTRLNSSHIQKSRMPSSA